MTPAPAHPASRGQPAPGGWLVVVVFLLFYVISYIDRSVMNLIVGPLEADLGLSDFQVSLLLGPVFGTFYAVCGLPAAWVVDRASKRWVAVAGVAVWGAM